MELMVDGCCGNCRQGGPKQEHACGGQREGKGHHHQISILPAPSSHAVIGPDASQAVIGSAPSSSTHAVIRSFPQVFPPVPLKGLTPLTLLDYPGKLAGIAFLWGCNMRCGYCHNPGLVVGDDGVRVSEKKFLDFLDKRAGMVEGIVVTGGEPCVHPGLPAFLSTIKDRGFLVKLDSNGSFPQVLRKAVALGLVDYLAMDIKAPLEKYPEAAGAKIDAENILESIDFIKASGIPHEFRTTVVPGLLAESDLLEIGKLVSGADAYYLQQFRPGGNIDPAFERRAPYPDSFLHQMAQKLAPFAKAVGVRGTMG